MSKFSIQQFLLPDVADSDVDQIGRSVIIEQARANGLRVTGEVERTYDAFVVGVTSLDADGNTALTHVPIDSPLAEGRTTPDARLVMWQADTEPITADPAPRVDGQIGDDGVSRTLLPREVVEHGGMVAFHHGLATDDVLISAFAADGTPVGYELAIEISTGEHQVLLPTGVSHLQATADPAEENQ